MNGQTDTTVIAVVITGPPGAGKSTAATAVHDAFGDRGVQNALIEVDELERAYPPLDRARTIAHVLLLTRSFEQAGYDLLFVTATIEDDDYRLALLAALSASISVIVRLQATPATLARRIRDREPPIWSGTEELVEQAGRLAIQMEALEAVDLVVDTEQTTVEETQTHIESLLRRALS